MPIPPHIQCHTRCPLVVILGCESKLFKNISTYSIFLTNQAVYRKDRNEYGGGVLIAVRDDILALEREELDTDAEIQWVSIEFARYGSLYLASHYRPPHAKEEARIQLQESVFKLLDRHRNGLPNILIGGDFNLPDINWDNMTAEGDRKAEHERYLDLFNECGLMQLFKEVTRPE